MIMIVHLDAIVGEAGYPGIRVASVQRGDMAVTQPADSGLVNAGAGFFTCDHFAFSLFVGGPPCAQRPAFDTWMCNEQPPRYT